MEILLAIEFPKNTKSSYRSNRLTYQITWVLYATIINAFADGYEIVNSSVINPRNSLQHHHSTFCGDLDTIDLFAADDLSRDKNIRERCSENAWTQ
mgnify:CR=1 FL=1